MTSNDVILIGDKIARHRARVSPTLSENDHSTYYAVEQYLKHYNLSYEEIVAGIVDGEKDCGIDAVYIFANGICIKDDTPLAALGKGARLDLVVTQVKNSRGFGEDAINKLIAHLPKLLTFDRDESALAQVVNPRLIEVTRRFLGAYRDLDMSELNVFVAFASLRADSVHPNTVRRAVDLEELIRGLFGGATVETHFLDAAALCELSRTIPNNTRTLALAENPISTDTAGGYIAVVRLADYEKFITGPTGDLDSSIFEANVRDYEGSTSVNQEIGRTLQTLDNEVDFWWLNNGVTIVAKQVQPANKLLKLESPQVVNGLQTSTEIYKRRHVTGGGKDGRSVLVKVIEAREDVVRERIIRATNSQTAFGPSALKATDRVQRQIEEYLHVSGLNYERRRRHYLNQGVSLESIVSIDQMGQAVLSVLAQFPHIARGRITRIYEDDVYDLVFSPEHPVEMFAASIHIYRQCEKYLHSLKGMRSSLQDFVFHLTSLAGMAMTRKVRPNAKEIAGLESVVLESGLASQLLDLIQREYSVTSRRSELLLLDQLAKDPTVAERILDRGRAFLHSTPKP